MLIAVMDVVTSLIAGFVIFTTFGGMAKKIGVNVEDVAKSGKAKPAKREIYRCVLDICLLNVLQIKMQIIYI
jgi:hypothetical protein